MAREGAKLIAEIWGTDVLTLDNSMLCFMNNVEAPINDIDLCARISKKMLDEYNCYPIFYKFDNRVYCRISAQIYN
jgi:hypothetical protein